MSSSSLRTLTVPKRIPNGATIGIVSPSAGLAELFPHRVEQGIAMLDKMGFRVVLGEHARKRSDWVSAPIAERVQDLHALFSDPNIDAIVCMIGGNHANQLLRHIDYDLIRRNPKPFIGYSDITVLHHAFLAKASLRTFYGPCLISEFGEHPEILPYTKHSFEKTLMTGESIGDVLPPETWTDEFLNWFEKKDMERPRQLQPHHGYEWWTEGTATGPMLGGALVSLNHLAGTEYWNDPSDSLFFIDIPEGNPGDHLPLSDVDALLADLHNLGVFEQVAGLIIGRPYRYAEKEDASLKSILQKYTAEQTYPILYNAAIGHTSPLMTVPFGAMAEIDSSTNRFTISEAGTK